MKWILLVATLCATTNLLPADNATVTVIGDQVSYNRSGLSAIFDKNILLQSGTLKDMIDDNLGNKEVIKYATKELFKDIDNQHHLGLLISALENNSADLNDPTKPSPQIIQFVDSINKNDLVWFMYTIDFLAIEPLLDTLIQRLAQAIIDGQDLNLSQLTEPIVYNINKNMDFFDLIMTIGNMLQQKIAPSGKNLLSLLSLPNPFNPQYAHMAFAEDLETIYIYDLNKNKIIHTIRFPLREFFQRRILRSFEYNEDGSLLFIVARHLDELLIHDTSNYQLLQTISSSHYDTVNSSKIAVGMPHKVIIYTHTETGFLPTYTISPPGKRIHYIKLSPNGNHIVIETTTGLFIYDTNNQKLLHSWLLDAHEGDVMRSFSSDSSKLIVWAESHGRNTCFLYDLQQQVYVPLYHESIIYFINQMYDMQRKYSAPNLTFYAQA